MGPPRNNQGEHIVGATTERARRINKCLREAQLLRQQPLSAWATHRGNFFISPDHWDDLHGVQESTKGMEPCRLALDHPAGELLQEWSTYGCPTNTGNNWTRDEMQAAINHGPHKSAMEPDAIAHFAVEIQEKVRQGQARVVLWDDIKNNPPAQLKISPVAAIPHKSQAFRSILDLSFSLRLEDGGRIASVNETTTRLAPEGSIDQLGHSSKRVIHAFVEAEKEEKIYMAKWDIQDGFWRLSCREGDEYNFAYVLPQAAGKPVRLVIPTLLQMGWVESPPFFCVVSETARDVATDFIDTPVGSLLSHKFEHYSIAPPTEAGGNIIRRGRAVEVSTLGVRGQFYRPHHPY